MAGSGYIKSLDGVRALAILLVMSFHSRLTNFGWIGVQLFFVLSGFLITGILWKEKFNPAPLGFRFKRFWVRRSLRIFPLYYGYLGLIAIGYLLFHFPAYFPLFAPYILTYTANFPLSLLHKFGNPLFNHLWSLSIEEQFYLIFPLIILLLPPRLIKAVLLFIVLFSPLLRFFVGEHYRDLGLSPLTVSDAVNFNTLCQLDAFCLGGLIPILSLDQKIKRPWTVFACSALVAIAAGAFSYFSSGPQPIPDATADIPPPSTSLHNYWLDGGFYHYSTGHYQHVWQYTCLNLVFASFLLALVGFHGKERFPGLTRLLENNWLVRIGKVSYGMYIFHWLLYIYVFYDHIHPDHRWKIAALFVPYTIFVYLVAEISFRLYESRFIKLKDHFFQANSKSSTVRIP
jgi:peptidoglycan/LPS O-acetylase OafA/YrhL